MRNLRGFPLASALVAVLLLAGCGSFGLGDILGGGNGTTNTSNQLQGTVDYVDANSRFISLTNVDNYGNNLRNGANSARLYFDNKTTVEYQGRTYRPEDLERGDQIAATVSGNSDRLVAGRITVLRDVGGSSGTNGSLVRGAVTYVNANSRILELDRSSYGTRDAVSLQYDANTTVSYQGRTYRVEDLQRGDVVEVETRDLGNGRYLARQIRVVESVGANGGTSGGTTQADVRGTVRRIDTSGRTIELERPTWTSRFSTGEGTSGIVVVRYDSSTIVEYQGRTYAASNLERGDVIDVSLRSTSTSTPYADRIYVVSDARAF